MLWGVLAWSAAHPALVAAACAPVMSQQAAYRIIVRWLMSFHCTAATQRADDGR